MAVKSNQSAERVLQVLDAIAANQPVGVSTLSRILDLDKNAVQRALVTLAQTGWIAAAPSPSKGWELTAHIFSIAHKGQRKNDLRQRARPELEALRNATGETAILTIPTFDEFIIADVVESRQVLRSVPDIGEIAPPRNSATGLAVLPYLPAERQRILLGTAPDQPLLEQYANTLRRGFAVAVDAPVAGGASIAAAIFDAQGLPCGAIVIAGPKDRLPPQRQDEIGELVRTASINLSHAAPVRHPAA
ncbi:IclR family transcriptional regulator [Novosphingobium album (ex Hu et al. 2023)]|uniref:IclR family transcriptional regulator n=1 Tax=Novosphingobium album (ex Hu et al. 2023) TaxID=2930093 RepID=A0ABT0B746_9SPHN|nr:IclR family transcriptional regulator [Novosphingobium album (ex Hu et al. 2023)]MCJ2180838.1 IclR family transcriptional regulator [Novosphingobium album (ex Hu et al. 2023)]